MSPAKTFKKFVSKAAVSFSLPVNFTCDQYLRISESIWAKTFPHPSPREQFEAYTFTENDLLICLSADVNYFFGRRN